MAIASLSRCVIAAAVIALGSSDSGADAVGQTTEIRPLLQFAQRQEPAKPTSANIRQMQERLVWIGYYDGPLDGDAGAGTTAAVKRFQRDLGAAETGTLSASQSVTLAERANGQVQSAGFAIETDPVTGIRVGIPSAIASQKKRAAAGTTFQSPDGRVQIGLRTFRTSQEFGSVYEQLKEAFRTASVPYSVLRSDWMVLSGETDSKRFYVRYHGRNDLVSGFFAIYDKELPTERIAPLSAAITMMSLTMQPFAPGFDAGAAPRLATAAITEPASLVRQPAAAIAQTPEPRTQPPEPRTPSPEPVAPSVAPRAPAPAPTAQAAPPAPRTDDAALRAAQRKIAELEAERSKAAESLQNERNSRRLLVGWLLAAVAILGLLAAYLAMRLRAQRSGTPQTEWAAAPAAGTARATTTEGGRQPAVPRAETVETPIEPSPPLAAAFPAAQPQSTSAVDSSAAARGATQPESVLSSAAPTATAGGTATAQTATRQALLAIGGMISVGLLIMLVVGVASKIIGL